MSDKHHGATPGDIGGAAVLDRSGPTAEDVRSRVLSVRWQQLAAVILLVALCDLTIYRGQGYAGMATLFVLAPILFSLGSQRELWRTRATCVVGMMLVILAIKLLWFGSVLAVAAGFVLLITFAMSLTGLAPCLAEFPLFLGRAIRAGGKALIGYFYSVSQLLPTPQRQRTRSYGAVLPLVSVAIFAGLFVLANPDLADRVGTFVAGVFEGVVPWLDRFVPDVLEIVFWFVVLWVVCGLLRPAAHGSYFDRFDRQEPVGNPDQQHAEPAPLYQAVRNSLVAVIALFAIYLVFEFRTLWFKVFDDGFYYSGYAHEGAAWLTVALGLSSLFLSLFFRNTILRDSRLHQLKQLAWIWSAENFVLAIAVFHRLLIYVDFNGLSRMRIVAFYGIAAVVCGFGLVVWKIARQHGFFWLLRRQLWTLAFAVYFFTLTPLDTFVVNYNVDRILEGDPRPVVQISVHPIGPEGILLLTPLLQTENPIIREGISALIWEYQKNAASRAQGNHELGWTTYQISEQFVLDRLRQHQHRWQPTARKQLKRFHEYADQWY